MEAVVEDPRLVAALNASYGIEIVVLARIGAGAVTDNYVASDDAAR